MTALGMGRNTDSTACEKAYRLAIAAHRSDPGRYLSAAAPLTAERKKREAADYSARGERRIIEATARSLPLAAAPGRRAIASLSRPQCCDDQAINDQCLRAHKSAQINP